jgi:SSS family transporter
MNPLDWIVLVVSLVGIVSYGLWKGRGSDTVAKYLLAGKTMPWYAMALSIMATQASAITFISTSGQAYVDGMRFVQMYFGLPIAMILISMTAVPIFHRAGVYTAYEYLERRFDAKTRALVSVVFLLSRGLASGVALYAPAVVLTVILGWPDHWTTLIMGLLVLTYTVTGGIQAVTWTDFQQMLVMLLGLFVSLFMALYLLPSGVSFTDALSIAGAAGRLNPVVLSFKWSDQYNIWSGVIGGLFLALAYFGTDQSQVQRYLTGKSIRESRLSLLFNAIAKIPMQFMILFTGAMVFVFYTFEKPPVLFEQRQLSGIQSTPEYAPLSARYDNAFQHRQDAAREYLQTHDPAHLDTFKGAQRELDATRSDASALVRKTTGETRNDTNYIFLTFVTRHLPHGFVGLIMAAIFAAAMSTISAEVNSLATVTVVDVYRRHIRKDAPDRHYLRASQIATAFWCIYAITAAQYGASLGSLIEAVNKVGSFFYPALLGVFVLAFYFPRATGNGAFAGVLVCEAAIIALNQVSDVAFLWYNVIGCIIVVTTGVLVSALAPKPAS